MAKIKFIRGDSSQNDSYTGDANSVSVDTDKKSLRVHDGITPGGSLLATETSVNEKADKLITITAGDGLTGGGSLDSNIVFNVGTPSTITGSSVNSSSADSHTHAISISKAAVGLSNVDNTSDLNKPVSTATQTALNAKLNTSAVGSTVASLVGGKVPLSQINDSIIGQVEYMGVWNASTNTPTIPATPVEKGYYYVTSVAGTFQSISYAVGDWIISNGTSWDKVDNTDAVSSVAGKTGAVSLVKADVGLSNVDNTSDLNKPVSTATQTALNLKANLASPVFTGNPAVPTQNASDNSTKIASTEFVKNVVAAHDIGVSSITGTSPIQVSGSSSVPDISILNATTSAAGAMSSADKAKLDGIAAGAQVNTVASVAGKTGAVSLAKADVGLSNVDNTSDLNKPVSTATQTALNLKANLVSPALTGTPTAPTPVVADNSTNIATTAHVKLVVSDLDSSDVGLSNVDNTSDLNKPVSTATQTALNGKVDKAVGQSLMLDAERAKLDGIAAGAQVNVGTNLSQGTRTSTAVPVASSTGSAATLSVATTTLAGVMSATDKTKLDGIAAGAQVNTVASVAGKTGAVSLVKADVGLSNVDNTSDLNKPVSTATQTALNLKANLVSPALTGTPTAPTQDAVDNSTKIATTEFVKNVVAAHDIGVSSITGTSPIQVSGSSSVPDISILNATTSTSGVMSAADKVKLDGIADGAQVNVGTNLSQGTRTATAVPVTSSTGSSATLAAATATLAGVMSAADKTKLDGIAAGAQVNTVASVAGKTGAVSLVKADVGLSNVDNTSDLSKPVSTATQTALNLKANLESPALTGTPTAPTQDAVDNSTKIATTAHVKLVVGEINSGVISVTGAAPVTITGTASNPVVGVNNATTSTAGVMSAADKVKLDGIATGAQANVATNLAQGTRTTTAVPITSSTGTSATLAAATTTLAGVMTSADKVKLDGIAAGAQVNTVTSVVGRTGAVSLVKADVGLSNVDNTSDLSKPVSTATQTALNAKLNASEVGVTVASLVGGKVPLSQINDSVIGQVEYMGVWDAATNSPTLPATPTEKGHYYVTSVAGTFQSISYAVGDWIISNGVSWDKVDNTDAVSSVAGKTGVVTLTKTDVGLGSVDNTSDLSKPVSTATQTALNNKLGVTETAAAATKLATARTINGVEFDGTANIVTGADWANVTNKPATYAPSAHTHVISEVTGLQGALDGKLGSTAVAAAATKLATARTIGGVSFDGTASINLPGVNAAGNQSTTGNAATATKLATSRIITLTGGATGSIGFDGSANVAIPVVVADDSHNHIISNVDGLQTALDAKLASSSYTAADVLSKLNTVDGAASGLDADLLDGQHGSFYLSAANLNAGVLPDARLSGTYTGVNITGNAGSADTIRSTFVTSNTGGSYSNQYTKFLTITIPARYGDYDANLRLLSYANGGQPSRNSDLYIRVKQQNAFGSNPSVDVDHLTDDGDYAGIGYVITSNTGPTVVDFYIKNTAGWNVIAGFLFYKTGSGGTGVFLSTQGFSASVAGIVDVTTTRMFSDKYKPTADALTTARTINGVGFDGTANITVADATKLPLTGGTLSGDLNVGSTARTANTTVSALASDGYNAGFEAYGGIQGTGYLYVGQSSGHGGGVLYNGDGTPAFATGETTDTVAFYRRSASVNEVVFSYPYSSNNVTFRGVIYGNGSGLTALDASNLASGTIPGARGVTAGAAGSSFVEYNGVTAVDGKFHGDTTAPTGTTRLNYNGYFYATRFYGDSSQMSVATTSANGVMSAADKARLDFLSAASGISEDDAIVLALIFG